MNFDHLCMYRYAQANIQANVPTQGNNVEYAVRYFQWMYDTGHSQHHSCVHMILILHIQKNTGDQLHLLFILTLICSLVYSQASGWTAMF